MISRSSSGWLAIFASMMVLWGYAEEPLPIETIDRSDFVDFETEIFPFLRLNCIACHNKTTAKGELNLETIERILAGGQSGPAIVAGKSEESLLLRTAAHREDPTMPPKENKVRAANLTSKQLGLLKLWIDQGAKPGLRKERSIEWEPIPKGWKSISAVAISPDGQYASCSRGGELFLYHLPTQTLATRLTDPRLSKFQENHKFEENQQRAHTDLIPAIAFSPNGEWFASGSYQEIKLWRRREILRVEEVKDPSVVQRLALLQKVDSKNTLSMVLDGHAKKDELLAKIEKDSKAEEYVSASNVDRCLVRHTDGVLRLWDTRNGLAKTELQGDYSASQSKELAERELQFVESEKAFRAKDLQSQEEELKRLQDRSEIALREMKKVEEEVSKKESELNKAESENEELRRSLRRIYENSLEKLQGIELLDEGLKKSRDETESRLGEVTKSLIDLRSMMKPLQTTLKQKKSESQLAADFVEKKKQSILEAKTALTESEREVTRVQSLRERRREEEKSAENSFGPMAFSNDGRQFCVVSRGLRIQQGSSRNGKWLATYDLSQRLANEIVAIAWDDGWITKTSDGRCYRIRQEVTWDFHRALSGKDLPLRDRVNALQFSPDGTILASGSGEASRSGDLHFWSVEEGTLQKSFPELHRDAILSISFSRDGKKVATGSADKGAKVIEWQTGKLHGTYEGHTSYVLGVALRADGRTLATGGADQVVKLWDLQSGDRKQNIEGWNEEVTSLHFVGWTGELLVSSGDHRLRWLNETGGEVRSFLDARDFLQSADVSLDGEYVIAGGHDGILRVWDGHSGQKVCEFDR